MFKIEILWQKERLASWNRKYFYEYWLSGPTKSYSFLDMIKQKFSQVKTSALVSYLLESANDLSDEEIKEMHKMLKKVRDSKK